MEGEQFTRHFLMNIGDQDDYVHLYRGQNGEDYGSDLLKRKRDAEARTTEDEIVAAYLEYRRQHPEHVGSMLGSLGAYIAVGVPAGTGHRYVIGYARTQRCIGHTAGNVPACSCQDVCSTGTSRGPGARTIIHGRTGVCRVFVASYCDSSYNLFHTAQHPVGRLDRYHTQDCTEHPADICIHACSRNVHVRYSGIQTLMTR